MAFGLELRDSSNTVTFSSSSVTWSQVAFFAVAANGSASNNYSVLSGRTVLALQVQINAPPLTRKAIAHTITVNGTNVSVSGGSEAAYILVLMK
jgi:hypothetical protein